MKDNRSATMKNVTVNTTQYEFSHGKAPRGFGMWAFDLARARRVTKTSQPGQFTEQPFEFETVHPAKVERFWFSGSYGDAVKAAKVQAASTGAHAVSTLP